MMISAKMGRALNDQVGLELSASTSYLAMASWCEAAGYEGGASYFYAQADEEKDHMLKLVHYLNNVGATAVIPATKAPAQTFRSLEAVVKAALKGEQAVTKSVHSLVELAQKEKDHRTFAFLEWFVNEQVQEETKFEAVLQKFDLLGRDKLGVNEVDKYLAADAAAEQAAQG